MKERSLKEAFLGSFDSYSDAIFRFCLMKTSNKELAEDFTQETFMRYWQSLREGKTMTNPRSYLYTIANNMIIDWYRKKKSVSLDALEETGFEAEALSMLGADSESEVKGILDAITELDAKDTEVVLLRFVEGLDPKDIAEILEESANVVSVRINRAIEKVQKKLHI
jgi:RNA polymerase sigma-70 factor (ECF subfamily)